MRLSDIGQVLLCFFLPDGPPLFMIALNGWLAARLEACGGSVIIPGHAVSADGGGTDGGAGIPLAAASPSGGEDGARNSSTWLCFMLSC